MLVRAGGVPVGRMEFPGGIGASSGFLAGAVPLSVAEATLRAGIAALLEQGAPPGPMPVSEAFRAAGAGSHPVEDRVSLTVAVCTRDRVQQLARALSSVTRSLGSADELVVIDNASRDDAVDRLLRQDFPSARYVRENRPGLGWARNRAILEARSEVIAFCDDDCVMEPDSLRALRTVFVRNPDVDAVTGLVEPLALGGAADLLFDSYFASDRRYRRRWIHAPRATSVARHVGNTGLYGTGASLAVRRNAFDRTGVFDAALGPGTVCGAGDDMEFMFRLLKCGGLLVCEPRATVRHEHRAGMAELEQQVESWSRGFACAVERSKLAYPEERLPYTILMARIALFYHARRATQPVLRRLALAELRGMVGAKTRYASSRKAAEAMAQSVPSPAFDASPGDEPSRGSRNGGPPPVTSRLSVDISDMGEPLGVGAGVTDLALDVTRGGRSLGTATIVPSRDGVVGLDRLYDTVVEQLAPRLMQRGWKDAVAEAQRILNENLLRVPRA